MLILDDHSRNQLTAVNWAVNQLPYRTDLDRYGKAEFWTEIDRLGGDCEDFAIAKRNRLLDLGWPLDALRLAVCFTETGEGHAVLSIDTDQGVYVLDNRYPNLMPWRALPYDWVSRQDGRRWVKIDA